MSAEKIIALDVQNFKKVVAAQVHPDGRNVVVIGGANGHGKSSVLDALCAALGGAALCPDEPIRSGEKEAAVVVTLESGVMLTRRWWRALSKSGDWAVKSELLVKNPKALVKGGPQGFVETLTGGVGFDALQFVRATPADQLEMLKRVMFPTAEAVAAFEQSEAAEQASYQQRTSVNRTLEQARAVVANMLHYADVPAEPISDAELAKEVNAAMEVAARRRTAEARLARAQQDLTAAQSALDRAANEADAASEAVDSLPPDTGCDDLAAKLANIRSINSKVSANAQRLDKVGEAERLAAAAQSLTEAIAYEQCIRRAAAEKALKTGPLAALQIGIEGKKVTVGGLPLAQASQAQKLTLAVKLALSGDRPLKVLPVWDASLLDEDSMALVAKIAAEEDALVLLERVGTEGATVIMTDGVGSEVTE